jgi:hypothetical protein
MTTTRLLRTVLVMYALEWELCSEDPVVFCYRISMEPVRAFRGRFRRARQQLLGDGNG